MTNKERVKICNALAQQEPSLRKIYGFDDGKIPHDVWWGICHRIVATIRKDESQTEKLLGMCKFDYWVALGRI